MKKLALGLFLATAALFAQTGVPDRYVATAATTALTIQAPAANARQISFGDNFVPGATVYCAAAQTATLSWNGTAATSTAGTELKLPGTFIPSGATVWTASNVGAGTAGQVYQVPLGSTITIPLNWFRLGSGGTASNVTIATSGTCTITFNYSAL